MTQEIIIACVGLAGVIIGSLITGMFQINTTKKTIKSTEAQFQQQLTQSKNEFDAKIEQLNQDYQKCIREQVELSLNAENDRFYQGLLNELAFYAFLLNELYFLNNFSHIKNKDIRMSKYIYPIINNTLSDKMESVELRSNIATLLGALRTNIDYYNTAVTNKADAETLETILAKIFSLISPIREEQFENYGIAQTTLRNMEVENAKKRIKAS